MLSVRTVTVSVASLAFMVLHTDLTLFLPQGAGNLKAKPHDHLKSEHFKENSEERIHVAVNKYISVVTSKAGSRQGTNNWNRAEK